MFCRFAARIAIFERQIRYFSMFLVEGASFASPNAICAFSSKRSPLSDNDLRRRPRNTPLQNSKNSSARLLLAIVQPAAVPNFAPGGTSRERAGTFRDHLLIVSRGSFAETLRRLATDPNAHQMRST